MFGEEISIEDNNGRYQEERLFDSIQRTIGNHLLEHSLTWIEVIGILELVKQDIFINDIYPSYNIEDSDSE